MKLYFSPGACSLSPHIILRELGMTFDTERVDLSTKKTASGGDFLAINPKGYIPTLVLDNGEILTEGPAMLQYLADHKPEAGLSPAQGSMERFRLIEALNFISTELHKGFSPQFNPVLDANAKSILMATLKKRIAYVDEVLSKQEYFLGNAFSLADAYLFTVLGWAKYVHLSLEPYTHVTAYMERIAQRPTVHAAMVAEGLLK